MTEKETSKECKICGKRHTIGYSSDFGEDAKKYLKEIPCHIQGIGYIGSLILPTLVIDVFDDSKLFHCNLCGKSISRNTYVLYQGLCKECYYIELQDLDDL